MMKSTEHKDQALEFVNYTTSAAVQEKLFASVMTTNANRTLAVGLRQYATQTNVYWNQIMASLVVSVPVVVALMLLQRNFVAGLTAGAVK